MTAVLSRFPVWLVSFFLFVPAALPPAVPAQAQRIEDPAWTGRAEYAACRHKLALMIDEARYYDRMKADLPGMEAQAAELKAKLNVLNPKCREALQKAAALEAEQKSLAADLPKAEKDCREAWLPSLSGACSRVDRITRRLGGEVNPELARIRAELPPLEEERQKAEDTLSVLQMNLQSRRNYADRAKRPSPQQIAEQEERCRSMEPSMGRDPESSRSALDIVSSASEGLAGEEISLHARLASPVPESRYGFVWSLNGRVFGGNGDRVKTAIPGEGTSTVRVVAWRWTGGQWVKAAEASRAVTGRARTKQAVIITGPSDAPIRNGGNPAAFEARVTPAIQNDVYAFTWGATGGPGGPETFGNHSNILNLSAPAPGRYEILVHAWKLVNGQWVFIGKAAHPFTAR